MKNLETRTTNKNSNKNTYTKNNSEVITFLRHEEDKIRVTSGDLVNVEIYHNGEPLFLGDKWELFDILRDYKNKTF